MLTHALVRPPGASFAYAISSSGARIDVALAQRQHAEYRQALAEAGLQVEVLPPGERYPDSCFVQDPALVVEGLAIIGRPGAISRQGEEALMAEVLAESFPVVRIIPPGTLEGGDVLLMPDCLIAGHSGRTNRSGIAQLAAASPLPVHQVAVPDGLLHLLTGVTHLGDGLLLAAEDFALSPPLGKYRVLRVPADEAYACNVLAIGQKVIMPAGYPETAKILRSQGFEVVRVPMSEFAKADGGITCLALVW